MEITKRECRHVVTGNYLNFSPRLYKFKTIEQKYDFFLSDDSLAQQRLDLPPGMHGTIRF